MTSKTNELALEQSIQKKLTGTCLEDLNQQGPDSHSAELGGFYETKYGYHIGFAQNFNPQYAIDEEFFWQFLVNTQQPELDKLQRHGDWKLKIIQRFDRIIKKYGILHILRKGLDVDDAHFDMFYQSPSASSSDIAHQNFASNLFSVTRQVKYSIDNQRQEIDMVLFINGMAITTIELKNHWTGQNAKVHGQHQYKYDRDYTQPLLNFARCLVHFAVDTDEVYMTTKLQGKKTHFLPFNKGNNNGKGNPPNPDGHKTSYLWDEIFTRESLANIIQHFVRLGGKPKDPLSKKTLFFPRYQQLDVVRKIINHASENGVGQTYLIQHSAGSGKSFSITWAAYQLIEVYPKNKDAYGYRGMDTPLFDSVIVVTDRRLLDKQIRNDIKQFSQVKNIVAPAYSSKELRASLEQGKKIIITTIQKFPFIVDGIADLSDKKFAVIIDEAHSSQGGLAHGTMNQAMGTTENDDDNIDIQDKILETMKSRKMRGNASYLAFTATPKNTTLEKFGVKQADGSFEPFHLYSMKQAIEEGFILDVLSNYTTYKSYYEISKSIEDNPLFDSKKAQKKLRAYVEGHKQTIQTKAEIMLEHFVSKVVNSKKLKGQAKAMVVTQGIKSAIRYYKSLKALLDNRGNPFKIAIAFSGKKIVDGIEHTETGMNGFAEKDTRVKFDEPEYKLLVVANKYLTGFDQPKLTAMYVDKKLQYVLAVQALSRLNRSNPKLGKKTEDIFVLDFFNEIDDIKIAFDPFYTSTSLSEATDINVLHELKDYLDDEAVYEWMEIEEFNKRYFNGEESEKLSPIIDIAVNRFDNGLELEDDEKIDFKIKAKQFVKIYGQMASILEFEMVMWEKLFWFLKFLIPKLVVKDNQKDVLDKLLESVDLSTYGLERVKLNTSIGLDDSQSEFDPQNPNPRSAHDQDQEQNPLDDIIQNFNEKWFQGWDETPENQRVKIINLTENVKAHPDFKIKVADNKDEQNSNLAFEKIVEEVINNQSRKDIDFLRLFAQDSSFRHALVQTLRNSINLDQ